MAKFVELIGSALFSYLRLIISPRIHCNESAGKSNHIDLMPICKTHPNPQYLAVT